MTSQQPFYVTETPSITSSDPSYSMCKKRIFIPGGISSIIRSKHANRTKRKEKKSFLGEGDVTNLPDIKSTLPPQKRNMPTTPKNPTHPLSHLPVRLTHFLGYRPSPPPPISKEPRYAVYIWSFIGSFAGLAILQVIFRQEVWVRRGVVGVVGSWVCLFFFFFSFRL